MFGKGEISIQIPKTNFAPGDTISGKVILAVRKPVRAKEVNISLIGEQTTTKGGMTSQGQTKTTKRIYDFKQQLDGEKEYNQQSEYDFKIKIPADILSRQPQMPQVGGAFGQVLRIAQAITGVGAWTNYYLLAKLDIRGGMDINKKVQIVIG
jgi:hypothetical protein